MQDLLALSLDVDRWLNKVTFGSFQIRATITVPTTHGLQPTAIPSPDQPARPLGM